MTNRDIGAEILEGLKEIQEYKKGKIKLKTTRLSVPSAVFVNIVVARAYAALFNSGCSFSGFNQTFSGNSQFLISPRHRFG